MSEKIRIDWIKNDGPKRCNSIFYNMLAQENNFRPLPDIYNGIGYNLFDVNSHAVLSANRPKNLNLTSDHIPSYKAVEIFLKIKEFLYLIRENIIKI